MIFLKSKKEFDLLRIIPTLSPQRIKGDNGFIFKLPLNFHSKNPIKIQANLQSLEVVLSILGLHIM